MSDDFDDPFERPFADRPAPPLDEDETSIPSDAEVFTTVSTSRLTTAVEPIVISDPDQTVTRRVVEPLLVPHPRDADAGLKVTIRHQKQGFHADWMNAPSFNLRHLKANEEVALALSSAETLRLHRALLGLYALREQGVPQGGLSLRVIDSSLTVVSGAEREILQRLAAKNGRALLAEVEQLLPEIAAAAALTSMYRRREHALAEFEQHMLANDWLEPQWQSFFKAEKWIFGHGLAYQILELEQDHPYLGGTSVTGSGALQGDYLMATRGAARFTVLVEIKRPDAHLLGAFYRNGTYELGKDVVGGVAQIQAYADIWQKRGAEAPENRDLPLHTYAPDGILVVGNLAEIAHDREKLRTFELFRQNLHNPRVLTFDELLARARYALKVTESEDAQVSFEKSE